MDLNTLSSILGPGAIPMSVVGNLLKGLNKKDKSFTVPNVPTMAMGGEIGTAKVEKNEVVQPPGGELTEIGGGTHESGNDTTIVAPPGTLVFSDRIEIDGKTLAQRKKSRERKAKKLKGELGKLGEALEARGVDAIGKAGDSRKLEKVLADLIKVSFEEEQDLAVQEAASQATGEMGYGGKVKEYPMGTGRQGIFDLSSLPGVVNPDPDTMGHRYTGGFGTGPPIAAPTTAPTFDSFPPPEQEQEGGGVNINPWYKGGAMVNMMAPTALTLANYFGSTPNPNYFEDFGKAGLATQGRSFGAASSGRDREVEAIGRASASQRDRSRMGARGVNTMRALDTSITGRQMAARGEVESRYTDRVANLFSQRAQMENQRDQMVMSGARESDIADRQDRSAFHTNLAKSLVTGGAAAAAYGNTQNMVKALVDADISSMLDILGAFRGQN